jgi:hypothetical protein
VATSKCFNCGNTGFEMKENAPNNSAFRLMLLQCSSCGVVVGAMDGYNIGSLLLRQNEALRKIGLQVGVNTGL